MSVKVNVSDREDTAGDYQPLPSGKFHCVITDVDKRESQSEANPGKPMLYFTMTVQDGPYAEKTMGVNACLWTGALYTIVNLLKAIGVYDDCKDKNGDLDIPDAPEFYLGRDIEVRRGVNKKTKEKNPEDDPSSWIEVRGFAKYEREGASGSAPSKSSNLLP
jgi:hypothetical protein